ncbi:dihydrolipoamide acetyltransferase family protein [Nocardioides iriomotensis]|uniref:Dihydrolipoamide acetyltransferase component of pyruvate dehydrogenase complex n=1 Tax=Nocardioides iriomotensis TaxID=715784 RepID=A0A4Q5IWU0_9ACTN|nr:dihydrolipoamide acetyltransferase family protein [Nocardioides iriomotensis]RYU10514.1 2-oxo acid dehydrogenase subunit E2 [Nocardioides iriomotensis]
MNEYKLPDVGEGLTEAEIVTWKVKVGDVIKVNDIVVEIETAKSLVELPSPYAGTIQALLVPEGETVPVGTPIIRIGEGAAPAEEPAAPAPAEQTESDPYLGMAEKAGAKAVPTDIDMSNPAATGGGENQTLVGYGPREAAAKRRPRRGAASPVSDAGAAAQLQLQGAFAPGGATSADVVEGDEEAVPAVAAKHDPANDRPGDVRVLAKPPVRKLAKDLGVDLRALVPSGPGGTITRDDVQAAANPDSSASAPRGTDAVSRTNRGERETREPIKGVRKMMAQAMVDSAFTAPHVTEWITVDATRTMKLVERLKGHRDFRDVKVSPLLVLAKAVLLAARRTPEINATWDDRAQEVVFKHYVNLGIAAATPRGLVVPNVKDADAMSLPELGRAINELTKVAREGKTQPAEMAGGTFTITNVGVFGVDAGTPIINPGESAILCFGAVRKQPWVHNGKIKVRDITTLALSFDHRLVDGEKGSRFLADVAAVLEDPGAALLL